MNEDKLSDDEIRELWAEHFPKRLDDAKSKALCRSFCLRVEQRAARDATNDEDMFVEVHQALASLGIPRDEFYQAQLEQLEDD